MLNHLPFFQNSQKGFFWQFFSKFEIFKITENLRRKSIFFWFCFHFFFYYNKSWLLWYGSKRFTKLFWRKFRPFLTHSWEVQSETPHFRHIILIFFQLRTRHEISSKRHGFRRSIREAKIHRVLEILKKIQR